MLELVLSCRHKDTDTRLSSFAWGGNRYTHVYKIWIVTSLLLSPKERGAWLERWGVSGSYPEHLHSWHFYLFLRCMQKLYSVWQICTGEQCQTLQKACQPTDSPPVLFPTGVQALHVLYMCDLALPRVLHIIMLFWEEGRASWVDGSPLQQHTDAATRSMKTKFQQVIKVFSFNESTSAV